MKSPACLGLASSQQKVGLEISRKANRSPQTNQAVKPVGLECCLHSLVPSCGYLLEPREYYLNCDAQGPLSYPWHGVLP